MTTTERTIARIKKDNDTRWQRAESWMNRAESADNLRKQYPMHDAMDDAAVRFIFWWIAFEAAYKRDGHEVKPNIADFIEKTAVRQKSEFAEILSKHRTAADEIMYLRQTHFGFWANFVNPKTGEKPYKNAADWEKKFSHENNQYDKAGTIGKIKTLFIRLWVVRNQIFHGAHSRHKSMGASQSRFGAQLLAAFVPAFIKEMKHIMKQQPEFDWGEVPFPRQGKRDQQTNMPPVWSEKNG
ncbi:MAG: hypothetical protein HAW59_05780 [Betaproteobacteria bacterium]|nr:hypothetical protein [Betaproteobacteria bacterium]